MYLMKLTPENMGVAFSAVWVVGCWAAKIPVPGEYVSESYRTVLESTRSPASAAKTRNPQSLTVLGSSSEVKIATAYDFNEGGPVFALSPTDSARVIEGVAKKPHIVVHEDNTFALAYESHAELKFRNIGKIQKYVNQVCLAGKFIGTKQEKIEFTAQGECIANGKKRAYTIGLYYPPNFKRDYFQMDSSEYGFKRDGDTLWIYPVKGGTLFEDGVMADSAAMVLVMARKEQQNPIRTGKSTGQKPAAGSIQEAHAFVASIYRDFESSASWSHLGPAADTLFAPELLGLIRKDQKQAQGEVVALDGDPFCDCQDFEISDLQIVMTKEKEGITFADVRFKNFEKEFRIRIELTLSDKGWRVTDISSASIPSLRQLLRR